jgi:hypothetical protein
MDVQWLKRAAALIRRATDEGWEPARLDEAMRVLG